MGVKGRLSQLVERNVSIVLEARIVQNKYKAHIAQLVRALVL
jgi:hypothetical protein